MPILIDRKRRSHYPGKHPLLTGARRGLADDFSAKLNGMSPDQLQALAMKLQNDITATVGTYNYNNRQYGINHFGGQTADQFNAYQGGIEAQIQAMQGQLAQVNALISGLPPQQPIDIRSLIDIYGGKDTTSVQSASGLSSRNPLSDLLSEFEAQKRQQMSGFFSHFGRSIGHALRQVPVIGAPIAKAARYIGASNVFTPWGLFLSARTRARMYGLNPTESRQFETISKVERGMAAAAAVAYGGYAAYGALSAPSAAQLGAAAGVANAAKGFLPQAPAGSGVRVATGDMAEPDFKLAEPTPPVSEWPKDVDTGLPLNPATGQSLYSQADVEAGKQNQDSFFKGLNWGGVATGWQSVKDVTAEGAKTVLGALQTSVAVVKAGNDLIALTKGPNGEITTAHYDVAQVPGASSLQDGHAYPSAGGFGSSGGGGFAPIPAGDNSSQSAIGLKPSAEPEGQSTAGEFAGIGIGPGSMAPAPVSKAAPPSAARILGLGTLAAAAYFYFNPTAFASLQRQFAKRK